MIELSELRAFAAEHRGRRGASLALHAICLASSAARSPGESRLRVCYVTQAKLPRPEVNLPVFDLDERLLGIGDLLDEEAGLISEFDGGDHRKRWRHHADNVREERLESAGLVVVRADSLHLSEDRDLVRRLRGGYARGLRRDRRYDRWTTKEPEWWKARVDPMRQLTPEEWMDFFEA